MKDTSRPHLVPSSRSAPYRKRRKSSGNGSPTRDTRRPYDASQPQIPGNPRGMICHPDWAHSARAVLNSSHRRTGGNRAISHSQRHTSTDGSAEERPSHVSATSAHTNVPDPSHRHPLISAPPTIDINTNQSKADSPSPGSVTTFLRSIELPDKPPSGPSLQKHFSISNPPPLRLPSLSTDSTNKTVCTNGNGYQVSLVYKGYPFTYDLSALPDDPKGTITLLNITKSDPGAYLLVGAHYRRTGRSRAACAVIRSLLDNLDTPDDIEKGNRDALPMPTSATSTVTLVSPGSPCPKPVDYTKPAFKSAAMRPAMLLLAACELDLSREHPGDSKNASHVSTAHELFRAVYGTVNDAILAGAVRPQPKNALGLDFSSNRNGLSTSLSDSNSRLPNSTPRREVESLARVKNLEKELSAARVTQKKLQEKLTVSNDHLIRAEDKMYALESHSREVLMQLDASQKENWELRRRLAECEQSERELVRCTPSVESRVWGRLKDLLFDNLGGGIRGV